MPEDRSTVDAVTLLCERGLPHSLCNQPFISRLVTDGAPAPRCDQHWTTGMTALAPPTPHGGLPPYLLDC